MAVTRPAGRRPQLRFLRRLASTEPKVRGSNPLGCTAIGCHDPSYDGVPTGRLSERDPNARRGLATSTHKNARRLRFAGRRAFFSFLHKAKHHANPFLFAAAPPTPNLSTNHDPRSATSRVRLLALTGLVSVVARAGFPGSGPGSAGVRAGASAVRGRGALPRGVASSLQR